MEDNKEINIGTEEDMDIITLMNDKDEEVDFYHIATIDYKENWYIFLQPVKADEDMDEDELIIFRLDSDAEGNDTFMPLKSEEEIKAVYDEFLKVEAEACDDDECDCEDGECDCEDCEEGCDCGCEDEHCTCGSEHTCSCDKD